MNTYLKTAVAVAMVAGMASPALADFGSTYVTNFAPKPLVVKSNGQSYTKLDGGGLTNVQIKFEYDTGFSGRVKSWKVWPQMTTGIGIANDIGNLKTYGVGKSYGVGSRPKVVSKYVSANVPFATLAPHAVAMCNMLRDQLRGNGMSDKQIFSKDREVHFNAIAKYEVNATGPGAPGSDGFFWEAQAPYKIKVRCAKWQGSQIPQAGAGLANPLHVLKATMNLQEQALMNGTCAVKLTTAISTNTAGATIKYRYVHSSGKKSPVFTTKTAANKIAVVTHTWDIPNGPGRERGMMRMEGVSPNFKSNLRKYRMNCKSAPGGFKPNPKKPKVAIPLGGKGLKLN